MKEIKRRRFRAWLEKLDPGVAFCPRGMCPLEAYGGLDAMYAFDAPIWLHNYMSEIDKVTPLIGGSRAWHTLNAKQALAILAKVA